MGLVVVAALGLAIGLVLKHQIEQRALAHAVQNARVIAEVGVQTQLENGDLRYPIPLERLDEIDREIGARFFDDNGILTVKLFNRDGRLVYSDDRTIVGDHAFEGGNVYTALSGEVVRNLENGTAHDGTGERVLEVYVPIRLAPGGEPVGRARGLHELRRRRAGDPRGRAGARAAARRRPRAALRHAVPDRRRAPRAACATRRCTTR